MIGPENSRHSLDQSHAKLTTWSPAFSRVWGAELVFTLSSPWLFGLFSFHLSGRCKKLWFWFYDHWFLRYSIEKRSNTTQWPWIKLQAGHFMWRPAYYKHLLCRLPVESNKEFFFKFSESASLPFGTLRSGVRLVQSRGTCTWHNSFCNPPNHCKEWVFFVFYQTDLINKILSLFLRLLLLHKCPVPAI